MRDPAPGPADPVEGVVPGARLPVIEIEVTLTRLVMYAAATWDFHRYHYDGAFAARHGMKAPVMDGQMIGALIGRLLHQWSDGRGFVRRLAYRLREPVFADDVLVVTGTVVTVEDTDDGLEAVCSIDVRKKDGAVVAEGARATVRLAREARPASGP